MPLSPASLTVTIFWRPFSFSYSPLGRMTGRSTSTASPAHRQSQMSTKSRYDFALQRSGPCPSNRIRQSADCQWSLWSSVNFHPVKSTPL